MDMPTSVSINRPYGLARTVGAETPWGTLFTYIDLYILLMQDKNIDRTGAHGFMHVCHVRMPMWNLYSHIDLYILLMYDKTINRTGTYRFMHVCHVGMHMGTSSHIRRW